MSGVNAAWSAALNTFFFYVACTATGDLVIVSALPDCLVSTGLLHADIATVASTTIASGQVLFIGIFFYFVG